VSGFYLLCILLFTFLLIAVGKIIKLEKDVRKLTKISNHLLKKIEK